MNHVGKHSSTFLTLLLLLSLVPALHPAGDTGRIPLSASTGLIQNGSFEAAGAPSLEGWQPGNSQLATLVTPGSPGSGDWSLRLEADWAPTLGFVTQTIQGIGDGEIVELQADVRAVGSDGGGAIELVVGQDLWQGRRRSEATDSEEWTTLSLVDTLTLEEGDSVWVRLTSFPTEIFPRVGLFDNVTLTVRGAIPVAPVTWGSLKARRGS